MGVTPGFASGVWFFGRFKALGLGFCLAFQGFWFGIKRLEARVWAP